MLQYLELCAEGPNPQALQETFSKLIQHLSGPADGSSSNGSNVGCSNSAVLAFEGDMLLQLYDARIATAQLTPEQLNADKSLSLFLQETKTASDCDQRVKALLAKLHVSECCCGSACT
jgi:hypothetical protein